MYEEIVKSLRNCVADGNGCCFRCPEDCNGPCQENLMKQAADAIENMSEAYDKLSRHMDDLAALMPRWIPVTERLPEQNGTYLAFALEEENTMNFYDGHWMLYDTDYRRYVTHWMPLPESPKEE